MFSAYNQTEAHVAKHKDKIKGIILIVDASRTTQQTLRTPTSRNNPRDM
jgi:hypothetical protein